MRFDAQKYYLWVLGCQMNKSDAERAASLLEELGFVATDQEEEANLILTMACAVRQTAVDRIYGKVQKWKRWKNKRPLVTVLSGCVLPADKKIFSERFDILLDTKDINQLAGLLTKQIERVSESHGDRVVDYLRVNPKYTSVFQAFVPIMSGCDKFCTYCAVPFTRGREKSRPSTDILREVAVLVQRGYKQITLLGQNVNSYGRDKKDQEMTFGELLTAVAALPGDFWIHYTSPHPRDMKDDVLDAMAKSPKIARQIHLPLQAGSTEVLKRMNRTYTQDEYLRLLRHIRTRLPNLALSTDIIVGFPGETEAQFEETRRVFLKAQFDMAYIAQYSPRPGTPSARVFEDDISTAEKKRRFDELTHELKKYSLHYNQSLVGKNIRILIEKEKDSFYFGKTEGLKNIRVQTTQKNLVGTFQNVRVDTATTWNLTGTIL